MEDHDTKQIRKNPIISLKEIPPLDPSSIPIHSSLKPRRMMEPINVAKQRYEEKSKLKLKKVHEVEEDKAISSFSNIQIDPNSTRSVISITQEKKLVPIPEENTKTKFKDEPKKGSAKSVLHERCASKRWRPPVYDCCKVEGPCHMRLFTYKVVVEIRDSSGKTVLECFGDPKRKKKAATEHAAEGALWYLEHVRRNQTKPQQ
ncbi:Ribonuclease 3-like protein 1 [Cardamine amara subsp. amara]|uniref:Ribonuclease 3-like protein 1 n=1 Tax=Cardamine amara subsp. amara TaxID=228776 RepID=A0ABD0ZVH1_CARAN